MKEYEQCAVRDEALETSERELVYRYEDGYDAEIYQTFESLSAQFSEYSEGRFAAYNVPIWAEYEHQEDVSTVAIGVVLTRHGIRMIWRSPATTEQFQDIQARILRVWAARADTGFGRFLLPIGPEFLKTAHSDTQTQPSGREPDTS